jgi:hypothetical protein
LPPTRDLAENCRVHEPSLTHDPRNIEAPLHIRYVTEFYDGRTLARVLIRKLIRRLFGNGERLGPIVSYNGLVVFDQPDLEGGGLSYGADYARLLIELGIRPADRMFEFCAGPGYIGFFLLSLGLCKQLVLADVNPSAVAAARKTVDFNGLSERVSVLESDGLSKIPKTEKWDVVVGNPPHFLSANSNVALRTADPGWRIHAAFYAQIGKFMKPGGKVILVENQAGSNADVFEPMITAGGGQLERVVPAYNALGQANGSYFVISNW